MSYIITKTTDNKNIGKIFDSMPKIRDKIHLEFGYIFEVVYIIQLGNNTWSLSNPNYILIIKEID